METSMGFAAETADDELLNEWRKLLRRAKFRHTKSSTVGEHWKKKQVSFYVHWSRPSKIRVANGKLTSVISKKKPVREWIHYVDDKYNSAGKNSNELMFLLFGETQMSAKEKNFFSLYEEQMKS